MNFSGWTTTSRWTLWPLAHKQQIAAVLVQRRRRFLNPALAGTPLAFHQVTGYGGCVNHIPLRRNSRKEKGGTRKASKPASTATTRPRCCVFDAVLPQKREQSQAANACPVCRI